MNGNVTDFGRITPRTSGIPVGRTYWKSAFFDLTSEMLLSGALLSEKILLFSAAVSSLALLDGIEIIGPGDKELASHHMNLKTIH